MRTNFHLGILLLWLLAGVPALGQDHKATKPMSATDGVSRGKQTDTAAQAGDVMRRLNAIENKLDELLGKSKVAVNECPQKEELKKLKADTLQLRADNRRIVQQKSTLEDSFKKSERELAAAKSELARTKRDSTSYRNGLITQLEAEITAVTGMGEEVSDALLNSMLQRAEELSPPKKAALKSFKENVDLLRDARSVLKTAPAATSLQATLTELRAKNMAAYAELEKDRQDLLKLLEKYCQRSKDLAEQITNAAGLSTPDKRRSFLEDARYLTKESPYLKDELDKALADPAHRMPTPNCN